MEIFSLMLQCFCVKKSSPEKISLFTFLFSRVDFKNPGE